ncbi:hypothetical protein DM02DRAFT_658682 [Periconia macrospinosa]|uniref:C2H2-type domain-containing protein n=1 Tax=Periconia macrospinosa TaxID=97972 RepID=A0A2V1DG93_9PLEO|nr:hypothetical protein DM02DRAFT_658682 [Periconia macrospinosa]
MIKYQPNASYDYAGYDPTIPQYTQSQIAQYVAQYGCYPPQPYITLADYPVVPVQYTQTTGQQNTPYTVTSNTNTQTPRTWRCEIPGCTSTANFTRFADLQRHHATVHSGNTPNYPCTVKDCSRVGDKGFTRRDHLVEHMRNFHHIPIPKRGPGERSAHPMGLPDYQ